MDTGSLLCCSPYLYHDIRATGSNPGLPYNNVRRLNAIAFLNLIKIMKTFIVKNKKITALLIILVGLSVGGYLVLSQPDRTDSERTTENVKTQSLNPSLNYTLKQPPNITNAFLDKSLEALVAENQFLVDRGIKETSLAKLIPEEADVNKILDELIKANPEILPTPLQLSDLNINNDNSKQNQLLYLAILDAIIKLYQEGKYNAADVLLGLKSMAVPSTWGELHLKLTNLIMLTDRISSAFAKSDEDPLNFLMTLKLSSSFDFEKLFQEIQEEIRRKIENELLG